MGKYKRAFPPSKGQNRDDVWKRTHWDKWSFSRKCLHVVWVIICLIILFGMTLGFAYMVFIYFGVLGFLLHIRDEILLALGHWIFD